MAHLYQLEAMSPVDYLLNFLYPLCWVLPWGTSSRQWEVPWDHCPCPRQLPFLLSSFHSFHSLLFLSPVSLCDPHGLQHACLPCPSLSPVICSNSCPLSLWCHPTISSSVVPFSSCPQEEGSIRVFPSIRVFSNESALRFKWLMYWSFSIRNIQGWYPLGLTGWISLPSKGLSRVFSNTTVYSLAPHYSWSHFMRTSVTCTRGPEKQKTPTIQTQPSRTLFHGAVSGLYSRPQGCQPPWREWLMGTSWESGLGHTLPTGLPWNSELAMQSEWPVSKPSEARSVCQAEWNLWLNWSGISAHWSTLWTPERRQNSWCCCPVDTASGGRARPGAEAFAPDKPGKTGRMYEEAKEQEAASSSPSCGLELDEEEWLLVSAEQGMWGPGLCSEAANYSSGSFPPSSLEPLSSKENQERLCGLNCGIPSTSSLGPDRTPAAPYWLPDDRIRLQTTPHYPAVSLTDEDTGPENLARPQPPNPPPISLSTSHSKHHQPLQWGRKGPFTDCISISTLQWGFGHCHHWIISKEPSHTVGGNANWYSHYREQYGSSLKS